MNILVKENSIEESSLFREAVFQLKGNKSAIIGFIIIVSFILMALSMTPKSTPTPELEMRSKETL